MLKILDLLPIDRITLTKEIFMSFTHKAVKEIDRACDRYREHLQKVAGLIAGKSGSQTITSDHIKLAEEEIK